jgi:putative two-component system response regulator
MLEITSQFYTTHPNVFTLGTSDTVLSPPTFNDQDTNGSRHSRIMIIDDEAVNIQIVQAYLEEEGFSEFLTTTRSDRAVEMIRAEKPEIVLLDVNMPMVSGLEILETMRLDSELKQIPAIVLTASSDPQVKLKALRLGASDFLAKPIDPSELTLRVQNVLSVKAYQDHLSKYSERLEEQVKVRTAELVLSRQEAIHCLARAAEYRDDDTGHHVIRVGRYAALIARELGFDESSIELLEQAAQLHDIGKIGIPDAILHKPGKLDPQEFEMMRNHCAIGCGIINPLTETETDKLKLHAMDGLRIMQASSSPVLRLAAVIAATHHEKWDGSGYPSKLSGQEIPIEGRIVAVADVFDALSSSRPYKDAFPIDKCLQILEDGRDKHFDPVVLDAFLRCKEQAIEIQSGYKDSKS